MPPDESVTQWIDGLKIGDSAAAQQLWEEYFQRLVGLARKILQTTPLRAADEEDVAISAFKSFCHRAGQGKFPQLEDRDDLWKILMTITIRKAARLMRRDRVRPHIDEATFFQYQFAGREPTPEFAVAVKDEFQRLLDRLGDEQLQEMALLKLQAYTNREIAEQYDRSVSFVERKLQLIRRIWADEAA
jgi:DNA-directed RNA polymerase specialized sigma24 family protein